MHHFVLQNLNMDISANAAFSHDMTKSTEKGNVCSEVDLSTLKHFIFELLDYSDDFSEQNRRLPFAMTELERSVRGISLRISGRISVPFMFESFV